LWRGLARAYQFFANASETGDFATILDGTNLIEGTQAAIAMKIYLGFTVAGNRSSLQAARTISAELQSLGHEVLTTHLVAENAWDVDRRLPPQQIFARDMGWLADCDLLVAEVSGSSFGVGFETGFVLGATQKRAILFFHREAEPHISLLITGNDHPNCTLVRYGSIDELPALVRNHLGAKSFRIAPLS
jgi:hypothetical protein